MAIKTTSRNRKRKTHSVRHSKRRKTSTRQMEHQNIYFVCNPSSNQNNSLQYDNLLQQVQELENVNEYLDSEINKRIEKLMNLTNCH